MNTIAIIFDGGSCATSTTISDELSTIESYVTEINRKRSTMVSIMFDGGTSVSNYVFGPSFDLGNSSENLALDQPCSDIQSESSGSCPDNVFIFDGGNCS